MVFIKLSLLPRLALGLSLTLACYSCKTVTAKSDVKVADGVWIYESDYPAVVRLTKEPRRLCTGTFVRANPPTVLTASHCLPHLPSHGDQHVGVFYKGTEAIAACVPHGATGHSNKFDIAVVVFPSTIRAPAVADIATTNPTIGLPFTIVGYGRNSASPDSSSASSGQKRKGYNKISRFVASDKSDDDDGMIESSGSVNGSFWWNTSAYRSSTASAAQGDSGGPLLLATVNCKENCLESLQGVMSLKIRQPEFPISSISAHHTWLHL